jgi:DNA-binding NtrC family response regulator
MSGWGRVGGSQGGAAPMMGLKQRWTYERGLIVEALKAAKANRSEAALALAIRREKLHFKQKYGMARSPTRGTETGERGRARDHRLRPRRLLGAAR